MFIDGQCGHGPPGGDFFVGDLVPLEEEADPDLLHQIGWKADHYDFDFYEAEVLHQDTPMSSWVEVAFCRQLGGSFVLWRSGVPGLDTPRSISYGWVESTGIETVGRGIEAKAATRGPALIGFLFDSTKYYETYYSNDRASHTN